MNSSTWKRWEHEDRFWRKVAKGDGCWEWRASTIGNVGYGQFWLNGKMELGGYNKAGAETLLFLLHIMCEARRVGAR